MAAAKLKAAIALRRAPPPPKDARPARSNAAYFARSSAQVRPRPPDPADLQRALDAARDGEARLRALLAEAAAELAARDAAAARLARRVTALELQNASLARTNGELEAKLAAAKTPEIGSKSVECNDKDDILRPRMIKLSSSPAPARSPAAPTTTENQETPNAKVAMIKLACLPPIPPPAPAPAAAAGKVRRAPEVVELYRSMMRRETRRDVGGGNGGAAAGGGAREMIGEIENRSAYLLAIKADVESRGEFIRLLIKEVENAAFSNIEDVVEFVSRLDHNLSSLVDERAVLKHFEWPERKADALREAAFGFCDLRKLEEEASSFQDDPRPPYQSALRKMQGLFEKLEQGLYDLSRAREGAIPRYKAYRIPWDWMLETGYVSQIKLSSVKLAMKYIKRVSSELQYTAGSPEAQDLVLLAVRFAFRVHQFAGGFDAETMSAFQELKDKVRNLQLQGQGQQQQQHIYRSPR